MFFYSKTGFCEGFKISGHANYSVNDLDIVCAAVSSVVRMCCNGIEEVAKTKVQICVDEGLVELKNYSSNLETQILLESLKLELSLIEKEHPANLKLKQFKN